MREVSKILSVVDPTTETQPAMHRAAWLARQTGLHFFHRAKVMEKMQARSLADLVRMHISL